MPADIDVSGLAELTRRLGLLPDRIVDKGERTVGQGCRNIQVDARKRLRDERLAHLPHLPKSFTYDVTRRGYVITGEVGADRNRLQGGLDPYIEYGTDTSPAHPHWGPALEAEAPRFEKYSGDVLEEVARELLT